MTHILRLPETTTDKERAQLHGLDKYQMRYLKERGCALCHHSLDKVGCGSHWEACPEDARVSRRETALAKYKPRPGLRRKRNEHGHYCAKD